MAYHLLGAHVNMTVSGLPEAIAKWKPPLVVLLDHSDVWHTVKSESPHTLFVGRHIQGQEGDFQDPGLNPVAYAREHCAKVLPWAERMGPTYDYWQGVNEPVIGSKEAMKRYADFEIERTRIMAEHGFRVVVGSFSVGNPHLPLWHEFLPALEAARRCGGALALHEYAWPTLDHEWPWYLLRHRKVYDGEPEHDWEGLPPHLKELPLLITEAGLDGLLERGHRPRGWRVLYGNHPEEYLRQLAWYDAQLGQDDYVAGAALYCLASPDVMWHSYDHWPELAQRLAARAEPIYRLRQPSAPKPPVEKKPVVEPTPTPPVPGWKMSVAYRPGAAILVGSMPRQGIQVTVADPWGNTSQVVSGSKAEYGPGGFEVLAPHEGVYRVSFLDEEFAVQTRSGVTHVVFQEIHPSAPASALSVLPKAAASKATLALEQADRILYALRLQAYGSIGSASMNHDGTIFLTLRVAGAGGRLLDSRLQCPPGHAHYADLLSHLGGLRPGEDKPVPPWPHGPSNTL
jgi:hypothetical protein